MEWGVGHLHKVVRRDLSDRQSLSNDLKEVREWAMQRFGEEAPGQREQPVQRPEVGVCCMWVRRLLRRPVWLQWGAWRDGIREDCVEPCRSQEIPWLWHWWIRKEDSFFCFIYLFIIVFFHYHISSLYPLTPPPILQSPHCCLCPWAPFFSPFFAWSLHLQPSPRAVSLFSMSLSPFCLLVQSVH